jgi:hypothetical protein
MGGKQEALGLQRQDLRKRVGHRASAAGMEDDPRGDAAGGQRGRGWGSARGRSPIRPAIKDGLVALRRDGGEAGERAGTVIT